MAGDLLSDIRAFLDETGVGPSYFGKVACGNSELVGRLEAGRRIWPETEDRVRDFMASYRQQPARHSPMTSHPDLTEGRG